MEITFEKQLRYENARKQVRKEKGFYRHLTIYLLVNALLLLLNLADNNFSFMYYDVSGTAIWWGLGLLIHGASVFAPSFFLGKDWEARKIDQIMNKK